MRERIVRLALDESMSSPREAAFAKLRLRSNANLAAVKGLDQFDQVQPVAVCRSNNGHAVAPAT